MHEKEYTWSKIAEHINELEFADNNIAVAKLDDRKICIAKFNEQLFAFAYNCPHASGILADGYIDPLGNIVCPVHRYSYSMINGRNTSGEGFYLRHWPVVLLLLLMPNLPPWFRFQEVLIRTLM